MAAPTARKLFLALCANAVLLGLILASMWARSPRPAYGDPPPEAATANGITVVPAQFAPQVFGCYLLDANRQTLCVYTFHPREPDLHLDAVRDVQYDRQLSQYNTSPPPTQMRHLEELMNQPKRAPAVPPPASEP